MGKYRDLYDKMMQDDEFEGQFNSIEDLPKFKDKYVMFDPIEENESDIHDVITDPEFSKAFASMSDSDKKSILAMIMNLQYDAMDGDWSEDKILDMLDASDNPVTSETVIDKDDDGDADITITKQDDGDDDDESLIIGGTDIYKTPFTEEQLAILRGDSDYSKHSKDEFDALQAADYPKARTARNAWIKRARELLEGDDGDKPHDQGLAGETTLEEELMLKPDMSPTEFSKKAAEKRGAKPGEPAPDFNNSTNAIAKNLASRRW